MPGLLVSIFAGVLPMAFYAWILYFLDRYEKEPLKLLIGVFVWGAVIAAGAAFLINTVSSSGLYLLTQSEFATQITISTLVAPVVEESLKSTAVLIIYLIFRTEFDSPLDGLVYGGITALGFAATVNAWYIYQFGFLENGWEGLLNLTIIRSILVGWQHPFYTAFIGLGFAFARRAKEPIWRLIFPLAGWSMAVISHFLHNLFAGLLHSEAGFIFATIWDWSGYLGLLLLIYLLIKREQRWMKEYLAPEYTQELLSRKHYQIACSAWRQSIEFIKARLKGNYRQISRFYLACGDLMHKKR
ncbi:MAG: PrsW family intramembrane metalloprotease, partial [Anaerolineales bacterium]|nr:PrsW family intramembrane metalloprotease [Anaerolineales bacterium]